jgi:dihydropteroate synthase
MTVEPGIWHFPHAKPIIKTNKTLIMGIVNLTPDSFSGQGTRLPTPDEAAERAFGLLAAGADVVDLGAESSRPGATLISAGEEIARLGDAVKRIRARSDAPISVDTYHVATMEHVLDQGADIINDISALRLGWEGEAGRTDNALAAGLIKKHSAHIILMHMPAPPGSMQDAPHYKDVCREVADFLLARAAYAEASGIAGEKIWLDPGYGFGKTFAHNRELLVRQAELAACGYPLAVGLSRKRMIGDALGLPVHERLEAGLTLAVLASVNKAAMVRVHDVRETARAVGMVDALKPFAPS